MFIPTWVLSLLPLLAMAYASSMGRGLLAGLAAARDPSYRVTPLKPWEIFFRIARRKLRFDILVLAAMATALIAAGIHVVLGPDRDESRLSKIIEATYLPLLLGSFWPFMLASGAHWAPRCRNRAFLAGLLFASALPLYAGAFVLAYYFGIILNTLAIPFTYGPTPNIGFLCAPLFIFASSVWFASLSWSLAWRAGDRWFRFED